jgi:uncharacterized integral membrane protein (TIGR00698 family)
VTALDAARDWLQGVGPGVAVCGVIGLAALFLGEHYGAPTMLFALLLGIALNGLNETPPYQQGIAFASSGVLRFAVALMGLRLSAEHLLAVGWLPLLVVFLCVPVTVLAGIGIARAMGLERRFGLLTGSAVAICGASAAMAVAAALPRGRHHDRDLTFAVIGVTTMSTIAMVVYPLLSSYLGLDHEQAGIFFGATIHDVAQVVGAGLSVSESAGDVAVMTKMLRISLLVPVVVLVSLRFRGQVVDGEQPAVLPLFLVAFVVLAGLNSAHLVPVAVGEFFIELSRLLLVMSVAAIGTRTKLAALAELGLRPVSLIIAETAFIAALGLALIKLYAAG